MSSSSHYQPAAEAFIQGMVWLPETDTETRDLVQANVRGFASFLDQQPYTDPRAQQAPNQHRVPLATPVPEADPNQQQDALADLVSRFSAALLAKLQAARIKYGYEADGFLADDWQDECRAGLIAHISKGDPRDVAAYCAFMWHHGWSTTPMSTPFPRADIPYLLDRLATAEAEVARLREAVREAAGQESTGSFWRHYKGGIYQLLTTCYEEATGEKMAVYRAVEGGKVWSRPAYEFFGEAEKGRPRFQSYPTSCPSACTGCQKGGEGNG